VWLVVAAGATFAALPTWYATTFSGFYLALFLILAALILRGRHGEYRSCIYVNSCTRDLGGPHDDPDDEPR